MADIKNIISGCLKGNRKDQEILYRRHAAKLYAVCLQYSGNDEEARDILQEGFIKIFENLCHYKHEGSFEGWIRKIMVNTALEKYRSKHNLYRVDDIETIPEPDAEPDNEDYAGLEAGDLLEIIRELPPKYRMVFNLFAIEGYSHCLLYTSDAADDLLCVDTGGRRIIKKKNKTIPTTYRNI